MRVDIRDGWQVDLERLVAKIQSGLSRVRYKSSLTMTAHLHDNSFIEIRFLNHTQDADNPEQMIKIGKSFFLHPFEAGYMSEDEFFDRIFREIVAMEQHEAGEWFRVDNIKIFDPHRRRR